MEIRHAADTDGRGTRSFDGSAHRGEKAGQIDDFGLTGGVVDDGFALGEDSGHQDVLRTGDGDAIEVDDAAAEAVGGSGFDVAMFLAKFGSKVFEGGDVKVDGARADGAASGK